jgi:leader peptidase (prepilin peptidase)/N-methyltransferase
MEHLLFIAALCFVVGALIGSFLSVCAYRLPLGKYEPVHDKVAYRDTPASIISPARSFCPRCEKKLLWWHNIPVVSWLLLRGRCHFCKASIPVRYPLLEVTTAVFAVGCFLKFGPTPTAIACFLVVCAVLVIAFIDIDYMIIPNVISYPGTVIGLVIGAVNQFLAPPNKPYLETPFVDGLTSPMGSLMGLVAGAGVLFSVAWLFLKIRKKDGLGLGDVKLLAMIGTLFGVECAWFTIFIGSLLGCAFAIPTALLSRKGFSNYLPFGPYLIAGALLFIFDAPSVYAFLMSGEPLNTWWYFAQR